MADEIRRTGRLRRASAAVARGAGRGGVLRAAASARGGAAGGGGVRRLGGRAAAAAALGRRGGSARAGGGGLGLEGGPGLLIKGGEVAYGRGRRGAAASDSLEESGSGTTMAAPTRKILIK